MSIIHLESCFCQLHHSFKNWYRYLLVFHKKRGFQGKGTRNFSIFLNTLGFVDDLYRLQDVIESQI